MADMTAVQLALRARLLTLSVVTTGAVSLSAVAAGYQRATGSFLTDGFAAGMELSATGFTTAANNGTHVVTSVTASTLEVSGGLTAESAVTATLAVGVPALRAWDNVAITRIAGQPYLEEEYVPATRRAVSFPAASGQLEDTGLYVLRWYGVPGVGLTALRAAADAVLALFAPGTAIEVATGVVIRVRSDVGPFAGAIRPEHPGWAMVTITVPWRLFHLNA